MNKNVIDETVKKGLCTGCGTCVALCPLSALQMHKSWRSGIFEPQINNENCNFCGICTKVCPGKHLDLTQLKKDTFRLREVKRISDDPLLGPYLACYAGHAADENVRDNTSSGGLVTSLLIFALEEEIIDGALVTRMSSNHPMEPETFIARTPGEVLAASRSKYCPVTANVALEQIIKKEGRYAVVGLPCHLHGIRKAQVLNAKLRERIILHLGIFCSHTVTFRGTEFLLHKLGVAEENVASIAYRSRGWPGGFLVRSKKGEERFLPLNSYWAPLFGRFFFTPYRCTLCPDGLAELADISFGDAWLPEFRREKRGESIIMVRTRAGKELVDLAMEKNRLQLKEVEGKKILQSQRDQILFKKKNLVARMNLVRFFRKEVTDLGSTELLRPGVWDKISSIIPYVNLNISNTVAGRTIISKIPLVIMSYYGAFIQKLYNKSYGEYLVIKAEPVEPLPPKIVIINSYSPNIGDLSIVSTMVNTLREFFPKAEFTVFATEPALTAENVFDVKLFQSLGSRSGRKWRQLLNFIFFLRNWLWLYFRQKGINLFFLTSKKTREALYEYLDSDIVISCGGGYLNDNAGCAFLGCLFDVYLGVLIGKPTVLYGQSIGPFRNKRLKYIAKKVLDRVNLITLRDEISTEFLNDLGIRGPEVRVTADAALLLPMVEATLVRQILSSQGIEERTPLVTITVKPWYFPGFSDRERNKQKYLDALIKLSKHIVDRYRANVLFVPMDISNSPGNVQRHGLPEVLRRQAKKILGYNHKTVYSGEIDLLQKILNDTSNYPQVKLLKGKHTPSEIKAIINNSIVHVATRMHSSIYAACQGTPILGIAYEPKMVSFMKALGQEKFLTKIEDVEPDDLTSKFDCLWENRDQVSRTILERVKDLKSKAFLNAELVGQLLSLKH